jgi:hypothetical protein
VCTPFLALAAEGIIDVLINQSKQQHILRTHANSWVLLTPSAKWQDEAKPLYVQQMFGSYTQHPHCVHALASMADQTLYEQGEGSFKSACRIAVFIGDTSITSDIPNVHRRSGVGTFTRPQSGTTILAVATLGEPLRVGYHKTLSEIAVREATVTVGRSGGVRRHQAPAGQNQKEPCAIQPCQAWSTANPFITRCRWNNPALNEPAVSGGGITTTNAEIKLFRTHSTHTRLRIRSRSVARN